jgi:hypothetical protein
MENPICSHAGLLDFQFHQMDNAAQLGGAPLETGPMRDESTKQAAQEYLAAKLTEEEQAYEAKLNGETAVRALASFGRALRKLFPRSAPSGTR